MFQITCLLNFFLFFNISLLASVKKVDFHLGHIVFRYFLTLYIFKFKCHRFLSVEKAYEV